jgi:hypothetical protein
MEHMQNADQPVSWVQLSERLAEVRDAIQQVSQAVRKLTDAGAEPAGADEVRASAKHCREALNEIVMDSTKAVANAQFTALAESRSDEPDYEEKKQLARLVNETLRQEGAVIAHPDTKEPSLLLAVGSPDGKGRYVLSNRETKKRTKTSTALMDLLPISPIPDSPRREHFLERRSHQAENEEAGQDSKSWTQRHTPPDLQERGKAR